MARSGVLPEALDHAGRLPSPGRERSRVELLLRLAVALSELGRTGEVLDLLSGERETVERLHIVPVPGRVL